LSLSLRFPHQNNVYARPLSHTYYTSNPSHSTRFNHPKNFGWGERIISSSLCNVFHSTVTSSLLDPNILLNTLHVFSNSLSLRSSFSVSHQVSHPHKTTYSFVYLNLLNFE
jgi:hypothetical protein